MSVPAISAVVAGVSPTAYLPATTSTPGAGAAFGVSLAEQVNGLQALQSDANGLAVKAMSGDLDDVHDYMIASSEAKVMLELTAAVRNKAVEAFTEIMRMQA